MTESHVAWDELRHALEDLLVAAGKPSCQTISKGCVALKSGTTVSHGTVNEIFKQLKRLDQTLLVVRYLGGDEAKFRALWAAARKEKDAHRRKAEPSDNKASRTKPAAHRTTEAAQAQAQQLIEEATTNALEIKRRAEVQLAEIDLQRAATERALTLAKEELKGLLAAIARARDELTKVNASLTKARRGSATPEQRVPRREQQPPNRTTRTTGSNSDHDYETELFYGDQG